MLLQQQQHKLKYNIISTCGSWVPGVKLQAERELHGCHTSIISIIIINYTPYPCVCMQPTTAINVQ